MGAVVGHCEQRGKLQVLNDNFLTSWANSRFWRPSQINGISWKYIWTLQLSISSLLFQLSHFTTL